MNYSYVRVSTKEQKEDRQINAIKNYCANNNLSIADINIITDKQTGKNFDRSGYQTLKKQLLRKGDILIIKELDRLGRNMQEIKQEWKELQNKGVEIVIIDNEILNTQSKSDLEKTLISNIVLEILSYMAEKENEVRAKRQREGIANAKAKGKHLGRPIINYKTITKKQREIIKENYPKWKAQEITAVKFMQLVNLKTNTFYKIMKEYEAM